MGRGNPLPVAVALWNFGDEGRDGCSVGPSWRRDDKSNEASYCCGCNREKCKGFQGALLPERSDDEESGAPTTFRLLVIAQVKRKPNAIGNTGNPVSRKTYDRSFRRNLRSSIVVSSVYAQNLCTTCSLRATLYLSHLLRVLPDATIITP